MLTKNQLGRVRTTLLTVVAASGLVGMTLQPALAKAPDIARPAIAVADMDLSALIAQLRSMVLNLQARIDDLEKALAEAPPVADELDKTEKDEADVDDVDEAEVDEVDQPEADDVDDVDKDVEENDDHEDADDVDEAEDDHDDGDKDEHKSGHDDQNEHEHDGEEDGDD